MVNGKASFEDLFDLAQEHLSILRAEFAAYGVAARPDLEVRRASGLYSYYNREDGQIYVAVLDVSTMMGILEKMFLANLLNCETDEELLTMLRLWIPYVISHEFAHMMRDAYGQFGKNLWYEEQIANQLATAVTKRQLSPQDKAEAMALLKRSIASLASRVDAKNVAADSYFSILDTLETDGQLGKWPAANLEIIQHAFSIAPEDILKNSGQVSADVLERLERRKDIIDSFNEAYTSNVILYMYYHLGWLYYELASHETHYVEEFIRLHLGRDLPLLPTISNPDEPGEGEIIACYIAHRETATRSEIVSNYFYKRYRSLLLAKLSSVNQDANLLLETWQEEETDMLSLVEHIIPTAIHQLLPHRIKDVLNEQETFVDNLPTETDRRLWAYVEQGNDDIAAATLERLTLLSKSSLLRSLPAEVLLELCHTLISVKLSQDEILIWEGEPSTDIYLILSGSFEVSRQGKQIALLTPGEIVGELAFFTHDVRSATVRAVVPSECYVLKAFDFHLTGLRHPSVFLQMAKTLAERVVKLDALLGTEAKEQP